MYVYGLASWRPVPAGWRVMKEFLPVTLRIVEIELIQLLFQKDFH